MSSLKMLVLTSTLALSYLMPAVAGTTPSPDIVKREPAKALEGTVQPSIAVFSQSGNPILDQSADLNLQVSGQPRLSTTANPDIWESELLDEQRRADPGFFTITAD
ncbi:hypothetical protein [Acaryochloris sp. IP29b_bin.137]|uniref:hypothetical protein n=1 Tax=Acaryochloris sp. IP29b_bin.137 TaxID=2969217 RepID=UPI00260B2EBB|nr:hypothetical protein [Acaryochloris sp. IP29b_bin.137]